MIFPNFLDDWEFGDNINGLIIAIQYLMNRKVWGKLDSVFLIEILRLIYFFKLRIFYNRTCCIKFGPVIMYIFFGCG